MFQHPGMVLCVMYLALFYARTCLFMESTSLFLLIKPHVFNEESKHL